MQNIEIQLTKRKFKVIVYMLATIFCVVTTVFSLPALIREFDWFVAVISGITLIGAGMFGYGLVQYFTYGNIELVVQTDGTILRFFNKSESGKSFNKSEDILLSDIKSFYVIRRSTRYGAKNYAFGYDKGGILSKEEINAFPSLFEATRAEMQSVLDFVKAAHPAIELGYENFFQKLAKR